MVATIAGRRGGGPFAAQLFAILFALLLMPRPAAAEQATIAVAANFTAAANEIAAAFAAETGHEAVLSFGSTGKLYTQIAHGAPFDAFLAADTARPERAEREGLAVAGSRFTYAIGRIVLWSRDRHRVQGPESLQGGTFSRLAIANPKTAPYGTAALQTLTTLGLAEDLQGRLVYGENIAQTYQFVTTGNAELGFVALSQVTGHDDGSRWPVPPGFYDPIHQQAVLLARGAGNAAARAFLDFLRGPTAAAIVGRYGYATE